MRGVHACGVVARANQRDNSETAERSTAFVSVGIRIVPYRQRLRGGRNDLAQSIKTAIMATQRPILIELACGRLGQKSIRNI
jgi:hypothetical protein